MNARRPRRAGATASRRARRRRRFQPRLRSSAASATSVSVPIRVWSGRPCSSSSAWAPRPCRGRRPRALRPAGSSRNWARARHRSRRTTGARGCTAHAGGSRSRASRRTRARRTRGGAQPSRRPQTTIPPPRLSRRKRTSSIPASRQRSSSCGRIARVEVADAGTEEAGHFVPARRDRPPGERQPDPDVELPGRAPDAARDAELEHRDRPPGSHDTRELPSIVPAGSSTYRRRYVNVSPSNEASPKGNSSARDSTSWMRASSPAAPTRRSASASISGLWSTPTTSHPFCRASSMATAPVPVATSSTEFPAPASIRETRNCRHRGS